MNCIRVIFLAVLITGVGCAAPKPATDPLAGWKGGKTAYEGSPFIDQAIRNDYRNYIQSLPADEKNVVNDFDIRFFEDGTGQRAVKISVPLHGVWWEHVLIYDKDDKRIDTINYSSGRYAS
jgi:hypothetical protein